MKSFKYIVFFVVAFLWLEGCSESLSTWLFQNDLVKDDYRYGDLYRMSNLPDFKSEKSTCESIIPKPVNVHLVLAGDSFTEEGRIEKEHFNVTKFDRVRVDIGSHINIDSSDNNILILQTVERHFQERFLSPWEFLKINEEKLEIEERDIWRKIYDLEVPFDSERQETVLFGYDWTMKIREWKAILNYKLFNRVDDNVRLSKSGEHLLYHLPSVPGLSSGFDSIDESSISQMVDNLNAFINRYENLGFDKVILSIIPNKTSILGRDLGQYNRLVERIQQDSNLNIVYLDMFQILDEMGAAGYDLGDTHWSCEAKQEWISLVNYQIRN